MRLPLTVSGCFVHERYRRKNEPRLYWTNFQANEGEVAQCLSTDWGELRGLPISWLTDYCPVDSALVV